MLSPHCTENPPTLSSSSGAGLVQQIGGLNTYVTANHHSKLVILIIPDAFGFDAPRLRELADKVASSGFLVVVPDFYYGDPFSYEKHTIESWLIAHNPDKGCEDAKTVIAALKSKGVSKVGVAGFCWGGMVAVRLAAFDCTQAAVLLHPGVITEEQINEVKTPLAILGAEKDHICPAELLKQLGEILSGKSDQVDSFVKIYPGVTHGWTVRYNDDDEFAVKSAQEAQMDMLNWLSKYIK